MEGQNRKPVRQELCQIFQSVSLLKSFFKFIKVPVGRHIDSNGDNRNVIICKRPLISIERFGLMVLENAGKPVICLSRRIFPLFKFLLPVTFRLPAYLYSLYLIFLNCRYINVQTDAIRKRVCSKVPHYYSY